MLCVGVFPKVNTRASFPKDEVWTKAEVSWLKAFLLDKLVFHREASGRHPLQPAHLIRAFGATEVASGKG